VKEAEIVGRLVKEGVSGVVLYSTHPSDSDAHLRAARASGMKIVVFDHDFPQVDCNFLGIDDHLAAFEATEHLIRLGCRELLFINSERNWTTHVLRERGFIEAASKFASHAPRAVVRLPNCATPEQLGECLREKLSASLSGMKRPLGVVAWWDAMALAAMNCLREAGWSIPNDAKVIGFSNDLSGEVAEVPLTTMDIPRGEIARLAASALISQMRDPARKSQRIRLKARLIIRESCGTYSRCQEGASGASAAALARV
jgi:LacI family transcriptional regulator